MVRMEWRDGVVDAVVSTWDENEEARTGLVYNLGGTYFCALTGKPIGDKGTRGLWLDAQGDLFGQEDYMGGCWNMFLSNKAWN